MKLTDFLQNIGHPIAYYPSMRKITGSTTATILLCQFIYWRGKESDPDGWLYKESSEIEKETGLSYEEQKTARTKLKDAGFLEEVYARLDHQMRFKLNLDVINEKWSTVELPDGEQGNATFGKKEIPCSLNESENTPETNPINNKPKKEKPDLVDGMLDIARKAAIMKQATDAFESALGFGVLDWETKIEWRRLKKFVITEYTNDNLVWRKYADWRSAGGKYDAMSNNKIRMSPVMFMDTGFPTFMMSAVMYGIEGEKNKQPQTRPSERLERDL